MELEVQNMNSSTTPTALRKTVVSDFDIDISVLTPPSFGSSMEALVLEQELRDDGFYRPPNTSSELLLDSQSVSKEVPMAVPTVSMSHELSLPQTVCTTTVTDVAVDCPVMSLTREPLWKPTLLQEQLNNANSSPDRNIMFLDKDRAYEGEHSSQRQKLKRIHSPDVEGENRGQLSSKARRPRDRPPTSRVAGLNPSFPLASPGQNAPSPVGTPRTLQPPVLEPRRLANVPEININMAAPIQMDPFIPVEQTIFSSSSGFPTTSMSESLSSTPQSGNNVQWSYYPQSGESFNPNVMVGFNPGTPISLQQLTNFQMKQGSMFVSNTQTPRPGVAGQKQVKEALVLEQELRDDGFYRPPNTSSELLLDSQSVSKEVPMAVPTVSMSHELSLPQTVCTTTVTDVAVDCPVMSLTRESLWKHTLLQEQLNNANSSPDRNIMFLDKDRAYEGDHSSQRQKLKRIHSPDVEGENRGQLSSKARRPRDPPTSSPAAVQNRSFPLASPGQNAPSPGGTSRTLQPPVMEPRRLAKVPEINSNMAAPIQMDPFTPVEQTIFSSSSSFPTTTSMSESLSSTPQSGNNVQWSYYPQSGESFNPNVMVGFNLGTPISLQQLTNFQMKQGSMFVSNTQTPRPGVAWQKQVKEALVLEQELRDDGFYRPPNTSSEQLLDSQSVSKEVPMAVPTLSVSPELSHPQTVCTTTMTDVAVDCPVMSLTRESLWKPTLLQEQLYIANSSPDRNIMFLDKDRAYEGEHSSQRQKLKRIHSPDVEGENRGQLSSKARRPRDRPPTSRVAVLNPSFPLASPGQNAPSPGGTPRTLQPPVLEPRRLAKVPEINSNMAAPIQIDPFTPLEQTIFSSSSGFPTTSMSESLSSTPQSGNNVQWSYYPQSGVSFNPNVMVGFNPGSPISLQHLTNFPMKQGSMFVSNTQTPRPGVAGQKHVKELSSKDSSSLEDTGSSLYYLETGSNTIMDMNNIKVKEERQLKEDWERLKRMPQPDLVIEQFSELLESLNSSTVPILQ